MQRSNLSLTAPAFSVQKPRGGKAALEPDPVMRWAPKIAPSEQVFGEYTERVVGNPPKIDKALSASNSMLTFHYGTMTKMAAARDAKGVNDIPLKSLGSIPGYSGFIPRRDAANVLGCTCAQGLRVSHKLRTELEATAFEKRNAAMAALAERGLGASNSTPAL